MKTIKSEVRKHYETCQLGNDTTIYEEVRRRIRASRKLAMERYNIRVVNDDGLLQLKKDDVLIAVLSSTSISCDKKYHNTSIIRAALDAVAMTTSVWDDSGD